MVAHEAQVRALYDDTPYTAWYDRWLDGHIHLGYWPQGDDEQTLAEAARRLVRLLIERLEPRAGDRVLDVGCGPFGAPAVQLAREAGCEVDGVTLEPSATRIVPERAAAAGVAGRVRAHVGDARALPFPDGSFDGVWMIEMLIHIADKDTVLREAERVLRPGGRLVVADLPYGRDRAAGERWARGNGLATCSPAEFENLIRSAGFSDVTAEDFGDTVATASFERMLDQARGASDAVRAVTGRMMYEVLLQSFADGVEVHRSGAVSYGVFTARKPQARTQAPSRPR